MTTEPAPPDLTWVERVMTVDAIAHATVLAMDENPGWRLLGVGVGANGQTTLTYGWPWPHSEPGPEPATCERSFELLGDRTVRVRYSCGKVIEFGNLPPWPANDAVFAARLPDAPHPHENAEMRWPR